MDIERTGADKFDVLRKHEFFRDLSPALVQRLAAHARQVSYPAKRRIFSKGDEGHGLLAVLSGIVKISVHSDAEREILLNLIGPDEIFGEIALLDGRPRTADATALTKCLIMTLDRRDFLTLLTEEPNAAVKLLEVVSARLRATSQQVEDLSFGDFPTRLARILIRLARIQGTVDQPQPRVTITQQELGRMIGLSRETTNRHLRDWEESGYVSLEKGVCIIKDRQRLTKLAAFME